MNSVPIYILAKFFQPRRRCVPHVQLLYKKHRAAHAEKKKLINFGFLEGISMGFTIYLAIIYLILFVIDIYAFRKGKKCKNWLPFIIITLIMVVGIVILGYLWLTSSM